MAEISADPRLGAKQRAEFSERAWSKFVDHSRLLIRQAMQDGVLPGQTKMPEAEERAALELREQQLKQTFETPAMPDDKAGETTRMEAGVALARLKELRDG